VVVDTLGAGAQQVRPWRGFFGVGIGRGRQLGSPGWRTTVGGAGLMLFAIATIANGRAISPFETLVLSTNSSSRSVVYVASALGTSLLAYAAIDVIAERFTTAVDPLRRAGQMTLTLYLLHIVVFYFAVEWVDWVTPSGLGTALIFSAVFWTAAIVVANLWHHRFGRGPAERVYRAVGG